MNALDRDSRGTGAETTVAVPTGRRLSALMVVSVLALAVALSSAPLASGQRDAPAWRNSAEAASQLGQARARVLEARDVRDRTERRLGELREREFGLDSQNLDLAEDLNATRERARSLAVESYIAGGGLPEAVYLLDSVTANDYAYRSTLISEGAGAVVDSTEDYVALRADADALAVDLAERIGRLERSLVTAADEIEVAELAVAEAEEVLRVARIHAVADRTFAETGRVEPSDEQWRQVRECESDDDYSTSTGNGFFGAYQFTHETWLSVGGRGLPSQASPHEQDARARVLFALRGANPWPLCGRYLPGG